MSSPVPGRLVIAATALWTLFLGAHLLLNGRWWGWLVAAALPPLVFTAAPVLLLALTPLIRTRRPRGIAALVLAATLAVGFPACGLRPAWSAVGRTRIERSRCERSIEVCSCEVAPVAVLTCRRRGAASGCASASSCASSCASACGAS